jgi:FkbM family methyltransferase
LKNLVPELARRIGMLPNLLRQAREVPSASSDTAGRLSDLRSSGADAVGGIAGSLTRNTFPTKHDPVATEEDVFYCFRLLLGRCPNPEEWPGHSSRAGNELEGVVRGFLSSREFGLRDLFAPNGLDDVELAKLPDFSLFLSPRDLAVGAHIRKFGCYEPNVAAVLSRALKPGMAVIDIGANIGYLSMLMAALVGPSGHVTAVEPNPDNIRLLEASRRVNRFGHVTVVQAAAARSLTLLALSPSHSNGMTGAFPDGASAVIASCPVLGLPLDAILKHDRAIGLVKIDVEGAELNALMGMAETIARDRPIIVSEFSPGMLPGISGCSGPEYLQYLIAKGYSLGVLGDDGSTAIFGADINGIMQTYVNRGVDHIDLIATAI